MGFDRRMLVLFVLLAVFGLPAFSLRVLCVGHSCDEPVQATAKVPFCRLPGEVRSPLAAGFREGRSPDILAVTSGVVIGGGHPSSERDARPQWPSIDPIRREVPLVLNGAGLPREELERGIRSDDIAPTVAALMDIERPHPEVRSGTAVGSAALEEAAPLVVQIVWKGVGAYELRAQPGTWKQLKRLADGGMSTLDAEVPSLPLDPAAVLATIGTGGTPAQHGITGNLLRNDEGRLSAAWGPGAPVSVISGLGDDLDELTQQQARVGMVADASTDRGLIGKDWYVDTDRDDFTVGGTRADVLETTRALLADGYGRDDTPDLLAYSFAGSIARMDRLSGEVIAEIRRRVPGAVIVVTATGSSSSSVGLDGRDVARRVESILGADEKVITATAPGGLFLDQEIVAQEEISDDEITEALSQVQDAQGRKAFADVFPAIAVSFGRYC